MPLRKGLRKGNCDRLPEKEWGRKASKPAFAKPSCRKDSSEDQDGGSGGGAVLFVSEILGAVKLALMTSRYALVH
jgi:hypothetical protein